MIGALNRDLPFDRFTIEQIAGDMLPDATVDQKIATGFHRNTMFNDEGGVDKDEARWINNVDRGCNHGHRLAGDHARLRAMPQPQVRSLYAKRLLPAARLFRNGRTIKVEGEGRHQVYMEPVLELPTTEQAMEQRRLAGRRLPGGKHWTYPNGWSWCRHSWRGSATRRLTGALADRSIP